VNAATMTQRVLRVRQPSLLPVVVVYAAILTSLLAHDWIAGVAIVILWAGWHFLQPEVGPPVLSLAFSFQWVQVTGGIFYYALTGRQVPTMFEADYRPMVLVGLGCLCALLVGFAGGIRILRFKPAANTSTPIAPWSTLIVFYLASVALSSVLSRLAWSIPQLNQPIFVFTYCSYGLLFLIFRRLSAPRVRWGSMGLLLVGEVLLGFTGYFAEFREALVMAVLALLEVFDQRQLRHWVGVGAVGLLVVVTGLTWTAIKSEYRGELTSGALSESRLDRLERVGTLTGEWLAADSTSMWGDTDRLVDRLWAVYFPALAMSRVPAVLPYQNGALLGTAVWHIITPRLLFPNKPVPPSESETVRKFSGVQVAGPEQNTTIAFGYAAESYVDFGVPWMFVPIFLFALLMGLTYQWFLRVIRHPELRVALVTVVFWLPLFQFDRSWLKMLGLSGTMIIYLGAASLLLDRYLSARFAQRRRSVVQRSVATDPTR
jgi:hypothetical protein